MQTMNINDLPLNTLEYINNTINNYNPPKKKVYVYKYDTNEIYGIYDSVIEASITTGVNRTSISQMINSKDEYGNKSRGGFIFSLDPITDFEQYKKRTNAKQRIIYVYKDKVLIGVFNSIPDASKAVNIDKKYIYSRVSNNSTTSFDGYIFSFHKLTKEELDNSGEDPYRNVKKMIHQYSLDGKYLNTYESMQEASKAVGLKSDSPIHDALNNNNRKAGGYMWVSGEIDKNEILPPYRNTHERTIGMYDDELNLIREFDSLIKATKYFNPEAINSSSSLQKSLSNEFGTKKAFGYYWKYLDNKGKETLNV